jgi:hypothetical protein
VQKLIFILALAILALAGIAGWQVGLDEWNNAELQDDLRDLASQAGVNSGLIGPRTDDQLRSAVIRKAAHYGIELDPEQVTVQRPGFGDRPVVYIAADYSVPVNVFGASFVLHFTPATAPKTE